MEYVALTLAVVVKGELLLVTGVVVVPVVEKELDVTTPPMPTQYEYPAQKLVVQSFETAGFQTINCVCVIPNAVSTEEHPSPALTVYHLLQFEAVPGCGGPDGVVSCPSALMARERKRSWRKVTIVKELARLGANEKQTPSNQDVLLCLE